MDNNTKIIPSILLHTSSITLALYYWHMKGRILQNKALNYSNIQVLNTKECDVTHPFHCLTRKWRRIVIV
jgi:hypothetical protein